uniref:Uncharacterized protein n=1 Tax=Setaria italica TaxID=4555 RepID=K4ANT9_SETIT
MHSFVVMISISRTVDPSKERVECMVKQEKNMMQLTHKYAAKGEGNIEDVALANCSY